ncbi:MAG: HIT domain-containing protein [Chloroflexota bacterium]
MEREKGANVNHLWAPWRMQYIQHSEPEPGCLFCSVIRQDDDTANFVLYRGPACLVMLNLYPYNSGHLMVVPYQHTGAVDTVEPAVGAELFATAQLAVAALGKVMRPDGFNLGINQGTISGAGIPDHIHLHVVPRWGGDTNFMPVLANAKVIPELLAATAAKLRPAFTEINGSS